jgi:hypothetical protein
MNRAIATIFFAAVLMTAAPALANGFSSFDQNIRVGADSTLVIQETVKVDFSDARHGIYRDIPVRYKTSAGNPFSLRVKVLSVTDGNGLAVQYSTSRAGDNLRVKIGDPDVTITGRQTYVITYSVSRALLYFADHDELYWNAIVEPWGDLGLSQATSVTVLLPGSVAAKDITTRCFAQVGSNDESGCHKSASAGEAQFSAGGTPLTVVVGWPKNIVTAPSAASQVREWLADNWIVFWPVVAFLGMFFLWYKKGRDPKVKQAIVVQYEPPADTAPAELGGLVKSAVGKEDITATIIDLAVRGYLEITEKKKDGVFGQKTDYSFSLANDDRSALKPLEERVLTGIFGYGANKGAEVSMIELQYKFYDSAEAAKKLTFDSIVAKGWFSKSPTAVRGAYVGFAVFYVMAIVFLARGVLDNGLVWIFSIFAPAAFIALFGYFMPARTLKGTAAFAQALGFKEFISKAETYRLKWAEKENIFEKYLPYAMVFGVVDKWAKAFEGLLNEPPRWYHGAAYNNWTPLLFVSSLNNATSSFASTMFTAPSAKGGGGFGGGGFGGGGFGGGGGGSW